MSDRRKKMLPTLAMLALWSAVLAGCGSAGPVETGATTRAVVAGARLAQLGAEESGPDRVMLAALFLGTIVVEDNCVLIDDARTTGVDRRLAVWPSTFSTRSTDGATDVLDEKGRVVARAGLPFVMGGGAESNVIPSRWFTSLANGEECQQSATEPDPWVVGEIAPLREQRTGRWAAELESIRRTGSIG